MATANPFRFSTKFQDDETDLLYYGYRYYDSSTGRWNSRDPIEEQGGFNLYGFVANGPLDKIDRLGLASITPGIPHVSNDRHNNYLIFRITCPSGFKVSGVFVVYNDDAMYAAMYEWYLHSPDTSDPHFREEVYIRDIRSRLGNTLGGLKEVGRRNCRGNPVEVHAYMRTRLVSPGWQFAIWRSTFGTPDPSTMLGIYQENTQVYYTCDNCCGRGQSN
jgi:RHS repeat-associated protein